MATLEPAHDGYIHQDVVTALAAERLLLPRSTDRSVVSDHKVVEKDRFDNLSLHGQRGRRVQIEAHLGGSICFSLCLFG